MDWSQQFEIVWEISKKKLAGQGLTISQAKLESFLGVSTGKAQSWKRGQRPSADDLETMALKLGLSPGWLLLGKGDPQGQEDGPQVADPLAVRVDTVARTMRESGAANLDVLRSIRAMLDGEISKLMREPGAYSAQETPAAMHKAAEEPAGYGEDGELLTPPGRTKAAGGG